MLLAVVDRLATMDVRADAERLLDKFDRLWQAARPPFDSHDAVGVRPRDYQRGSLVLTQRGEDIIKFLLQGLSTREIAAELFLSSKTIANYVARIYLKLGISSRKELPARLKAQGSRR